MILRAVPQHIQDRLLVNRDFMKPRPQRLDKAAS